jgi:hypothetical protein
VLRVLRLIWPEGKAPWGVTDTAVYNVVCDHLKAERKAGQTPESEKDLPDDVSRGVVIAAVNAIGRADKPSAS